jgi:hypothetical protein
MRRFLCFAFGLFCAASSPGATLRGVVRGVDGELPGAAVRLLADRKEVARTMTDRDGSWELPRPGTGDLTLSIEMTGFATSSGPLCRTTGNDLDITLQEGLAGAQWVTASPPPGQPRRIPPAQILFEGEVRDVEGHEIGGAKLEVRTFERKPAHGRTDRQGRFHILIPNDEVRIQSFTLSRKGFLAVQGTIDPHVRRPLVVTMFPDCR